MLATLFSVFFVLSTLDLTNRLSCGIKQARSALGADLVLLPEENNDAAVLYGGSPITCKMDREIFSEVKGMKHATACFYRIYLATLSGASCCDASVQIVGTQMEEDFLLRAIAQSTGLRHGEIIVGSRTGLDVDDSPKYFSHPFRVTEVLPKTGTAVDLSVYICIDDAREIIRDIADKKEGLDQNALAGYPEFGLSDISAIFIQSDNAKILDNMIKSRYGKRIFVTAPDKKTAEYVKEVGLIQKAGNILIFVCALLSALMIACVSYLHTIHRRSETGAYFFFGFSKKKILHLYVSEMVCVNIAGTLLGSILYMVLFGSFSNLIEHEIGLPMISESYKMVPYVFLVLLISAFFSIVFVLLSGGWILKTQPAELIKEGN